MTRVRDREKDEPPVRRGLDRLDRRRGDEFLNDVSLNCESLSESGIVVLDLRLCLILKPSRWREVTGCHGLDRGGRCPAIKMDFISQVLKII